MLDVASQGGTKTDGNLVLTGGDKSGNIEKDGKIGASSDNGGSENRGKSYLKKSLDQVVLGNYTDDVTALGTAGQIGLGLVGLDLPADIRDLTYDKKW